METRIALKNIAKPAGWHLFLLLVVLLLSLAIIFDFNLVWASDKFSLKVFTLPLVSSAALSGALGYGVIPLLKKLKAAQIIQTDGPQTHLKKAGTPTMGGVFFLPVAALLALIWSGFATDVVVVSCVTLAYGLIGWLDDWQILRQQSNKGISPRMKLLLQAAVAVGFCLWLLLTQPATITDVNLPFGINLSLGWAFWLLALFVMAAESNATNLTDGVDGLAAGTGAVAILGLGAVAFAEHPDLSVFCACLGGACLGFVLHNHNPATVFMGDTGSLALGAALASVGILSQNLWGLLLVSGIFLIESISVIAQVGYYKATKGPDGKGKRLLKMAPLHHHLELSGWAETQIVGAFYLIATVLVVAGYWWS